MASVVLKYFHSLRVYGIRGTIERLYSMGQIKFGECVGEDRFGNKYFENRHYPWGQHRWVEYKDIHNFDASMIPPEWHGWMHHTFDETPTEMDVKQALEGVKTLYKSDALYKNHVADGKPMEYHMHNRSTWRQRGYRVGSLYTQPSQEDAYYKQPAHPLAETSEEATFPPNSTEQEYARKGFKKPSGEYDYDGPIESLTDHRH